MSDQTTSSTSRATSVPPQATSPEPTSHRVRESYDSYGNEPTLWVGWIAFAGTMMALVGTFQAIEGLVALFQDSYFLVGKNDLVVHVDYTTWGWVHLIMGIIVASAGVALFSGHMWARIVAVGVAFLSALLNVAFLAAYPIWSAIMITLDVLVMWAIIVHGREVE